MSDYISELRKLVGHKPLILSTAGAIVLDKHDRVLLHHRCDNDLWGLPGGVIELGESVEDAAIREVFEETGIKVDNLKLFNIYSGANQHYIYPNGDEVYYVCITYYTRTFNGQTQIDGIESKDVGFFDVNNLPQLSQPIKCILEELRHRINNNLLQ
ncbi:NUDIX hydrolase [Vallitalea maricola]|uniref:NUDIX hydrolase n=1 Tax=Vallitalea maricola TaxID=3074433 RepID=A0ACB5UPW9_9FIRM|nr:NUDIX hydrolase [Vallitalea sp. AN17-2]